MNSTLLGNFDKSNRQKRYIDKRSKDKSNLEYCLNGLLFQDEYRLHGKGNARLTTSTSDLV